jgi:hypothetical protein
MEHLTVVLSLFSIVGILWYALKNKGDVRADLRLLGARFSFEAKEKPATNPSHPEILPPTG